MVFGLVRRLHVKRLYGELESASRRQRSFEYYVRVDEDNKN